MGGKEDVTAMEGRGGEEEGRAWQEEARASEVKGCRFPWSPCQHSCSQACSVQFNPISQPVRLTKGGYTSGKPTRRLMTRLVGAYSAGGRGHPG